MAALVETMFSVRSVPWHGLGKILSDYPTSSEAIKEAGLDWEVESHEIRDHVTGIKIPDYMANVRSSDGSVLGVVGSKYKIVQNKEAFDFTDSLIGDEVKYETAGSLCGGKKVWLLAKLPERKILDDSIGNYVCFTNSHDGKGAIQVCMTPVRVVCNNTLNLALSTAKRIWTTRHMGNIDLKLEEAKQTLMFADSYMDELGKTAEELALQKISTEQVKEFLSELFPVSENDSDRTKHNMEEARDAFMVCYFAPDLANFKGSAWQLVNAAADFAGHAKPSRNTSSYQENNWGKIMNGHPILDKTYAFINSVA